MKSICSYRSVCIIIRPPFLVPRPSARSVACEGELGMRPDRWGVCGGMECLSELWRGTNGWVCVHACGQCFGCWLGINCQFWTAVSQEVTKCLCVVCLHIRCMASPLSSTLTDAACDSSPQQIKRLQCWVGVYNNANASKTTFTHRQLRTSECWWTISHSSISLHDRSGRRWPQS